MKPSKSQKVQVIESSVAEVTQQQQQQQKSPKKVQEEEKKLQEESQKKVQEKPKSAGEKEKEKGKGKDKVEVGKGQEKKDEKVESKQKGKVIELPQELSTGNENKRKHSSSHDEDDSESDEEIDDIIDVDFEFFNLKESDYHSIKHFLSNLFATEKIDLVELTDLLLSQNSIGSAVKIDGNSDPYSFLSIINLTHHQEKKCVQQIKRFLISKVTGDKQEKLTKYLEDPFKHIGFVFNERIMNMPIQTSPPMFKMLTEEIQWACQDGEPFNFEYYLFFMKTYKERVEISNSTNERQGKKPKLQEKDELFYFNEEEELIANETEFQFDLKFGKGSWTFQDEGISYYRKIAIIHKSKFPELLKQIDQFAQLVETTA